MADVAMRILLSASQGNTIGVINTVVTALGGAGGLAGTLLAVGLAVDGAAIALGVTAVQAAGDFQAQTERLVTSAGELQSNLDLVRQGILQLSVDTATSTQQLAAGMYYVESAGYHAADALTVLKAAAEGAKSENADLDVVAKALTTVLTDYHLSANQAADAMSALIVAVQNGKTNLQELAASMGAVLPIASSLGISFPQVAGAMDTMTNAGMSARQAAQNLAHVLLALSAPSNIAVKAMQDVGLSAQQVKDALINQGLPEALQMIEDAVGKKFPVGSVAYEEALKKILGGIVGVKVAAMLTGDSLAQTEQNIKKIADAMKNSHGTVLGFADIQTTLNFRLDQARQAMNALLILIGTGLLPIATRLVTLVGEGVARFMAWFTASGILQQGISILSTVLGKVVDVIQAVATWVQHNKLAMDALKVVVIGLAIIIGAFLLAGLALVILTLTTLAVVIGVVVAVIMGIIWVVQHWGQIWTTVVNWVKGVWQGFTDWLGRTLKAIGQFFTERWHETTTKTGDFFTALVGLGKRGLQALLEVITFPFRAIGALFVWLYAHNYYFQALVDSIRRIFTGGIAWLRQAWQTVTTWLGNLWQSIVGIATTVWTAVSGSISDAVTAVWNWLVGVWTTVTGWLSAQWNKLAGFATTAWNNVVGVFKGVWGSISGTLGDLWNNLSDWFGNLATKALDWGTGLIQGFINGIAGMAGHVREVLARLAKIIADFIGFHSPAKEGPGAELNLWPQNLIASYAAGLRKAIPTLQTSLALVMRPVGGALSGQGLGPGGLGRSGPMLSSGGHTINLTLSSTVPATQQQIRQIADWVEQELGRRVRGQTAGYNTAYTF